MAETFREALFRRAGLPVPRPGACLVVAEVAQAHDGSLGQAHAFIDAAARAGADVIKFQTHIAAEESTPAEPWRIAFSLQDESRYAYWQRMEFTADQWQGLAEHAHRRGLIFLSSPFSVAAVELLDRLGMVAWKVASGELRSDDLLEAIVATGQPVLLSTGMSDWGEIDRVVQRLGRSTAPLVLMQCTSRYPCPPEKVGLNVMEELAERYGRPVGLSDHSGTIFPSLAAAVLGAEVVEVHVTFSREMFGPDVPASVTFDELALLVEGVRFIEAMRAHPVDKDAEAHQLAPLRALFTKSIVAARDLPAGTRLEQKDLALRKPGTGLPPEDLPKLIGRVLARPLSAQSLLRLSDIES